MGGVAPLTGGPLAAARARRQGAGVDGTWTVEAAAGSYRREGPDTRTWPHRWTAGGVSVQSAFTGAHLLHLAVAGCVLNDLYREAPGCGVVLGGVRVTARGGSAAGSWASTGIAYEVVLDTQAGAEEVERLLERVDDVAEVPRAVRAGAGVRRAG